ncbi:MAG: TPM domain-containing protein [Paracoccaceae bacterium]
MRRIAALFLALTCLVMAPAAAQELPQPLSDTVSDFAGVLTPEDSASLTRTLAAARQETGVQIVAVTMDRIPDGQRIEDYAKTLFNAWGVGDKSRNDGIMILLARGDRAVRVALGAGYDPVWDGAAQRAIDTAMLPAFREGKFAQGLQAGAEAVIDRVARPHSAGQPAPAAPDRPWSDFLIPGGMVAGFAALVLASRRRRRDGRPARCPSCGATDIRREQQTWPVWQWTCPACGWRRDVALRGNPNDPNRRNHRRDDGPGGGFGGGSSSGGGATGRW